MIKPFLATLAVAGVVAGGAASAATVSTTFVIHGNSCTSVSQGVPLPLYSQYGPYSNSTTYGVYVSCPVVLQVPSKAGQVQSALLQVSGRNKNEGTPLRCTLLGTSVSGTSPVSARIALAGNASYNDGSISLRTGSSLNSDVLSITCWLPPKIGSNRSYLTTLVLSVFYDE